MGIIDEGFYKKCLGLDKKTRLVLMGSIATKRRRTVYVGGKAVLYEPKTSDPVLRSAWFNIVDYVDKCLHEFATLCGDRFIFYWVDGIYLEGKPEEFKGVMETISAKYGLDFKEEPTDRIEIRLDEWGHKFAAIYKKELAGEERPYKSFYLTKNGNKNENTD